MAPFQGPSREQLVKLLSSGAPLLPITLGRGEPMATVSCVDGVWRLRPLILDEEKCSAFGREQLAAGKNFMPEHTFAFKFEGEPLIEEATKEAFIARLESLRWKWLWKW